MHLLNEPLSSGVLTLYLAVKFDSPRLCEVPVSSGKDETGFSRAAFPSLFSYWSSQSLGGLSDFSALQLRRKQLWALSHLGTVLQLQLSEHPHLPLCYQPVTSGLRSKARWCGSGGRKGWRCMRGREWARGGRQLRQVALPVLTHSDHLSFPSSSATLPLEAGKLIFLLIWSALPKYISCMKMWDMFLLGTIIQDLYLN